MQVELGEAAALLGECQGERLRARVADRVSGEIEGAQRGAATRGREAEAQCERGSMGAWRVGEGDSERREREWWKLSKSGTAVTAGSVSI